MKAVRTLEEISDGKMYDIEDMVEADAGGCNGCSACCHNVGDLVVLTPFDIYALTRYMNESFDTLLKDSLELYEENKIQLPHLKMKGPDARCHFLNSEGRCSIHPCRPNICRLFPLGRVYENQNFKYFLQVGSCIKPKLSKVQIKDWISIENYTENKAFLIEWHQLIKALTFRLKFVYDEAEKQSIQQYVLDTFYRNLLKGEEDFYKAFWRQLPEAKKHLGIL